MMQTPDKVLAEAAAGQDGEARAREVRGNSVPRHREAGPGVWEVRAGCIGRGHAGKTALFRAMSEGPIGDFFPSGLHVDVGDPREVAQMIREAEETQRILQMSGLPPTLEASQIRYYLYDGDEQLVVYKMREVIGQVLTHTLPNSAQEQQARYDEYLKSLLNTHVLWAVIPCCPPKPTARDRRRYANDLRITGAYLREALRLRPSDQPVAVALVISKIDTLFQDADGQFGPGDEALDQQPVVLREQRLQCGRGFIGGLADAHVNATAAVQRLDHARGADANWGRIVMAVGKAGEPADRDKLSVGIGGTWMARNGAVVPGYDEGPVVQHMKGREISVAVDLALGKGSATAWTCDLTHGYIDINGSYRS